MGGRRCIAADGCNRSSEAAAQSPTGALAPPRQVKTHPSTGCVLTTIYNVTASFLISH